MSLCSTGVPAHNGPIHDMPSALSHHVATTPSRSTYRAVLRTCPRRCICGLCNCLTVADFSTVQEAIQPFKRAYGARLNPRKSRALPIGRWSASDNILGIPCRHHVRILGHITTDRLRLVDPTCRTGRITSKGLLSSKSVSRT